MPPLLGWLLTFLFAVVLFGLFRATDLEARIPLNMNVLDKGVTPKVMSLRDVLQAFIDEGIVESDFAGSTGYGYDDAGRARYESLLARVLGAERARARHAAARRR